MGVYSEVVKFEHFFPIFFSIYTPGRIFERLVDGHTKATEHLRRLGLFEVYTRFK